MMKLKIQEQTEKEEKKKNSLKEVLKEILNDFRNSLAEHLSMCRKILIFSMKLTHFFYRVISGLLLRLAIILFICNIGYPDETKMFVQKAFTVIQEIYYSINNFEGIPVKLAEPHNVQFFILILPILISALSCMAFNWYKYKQEVEEL